MSLTSLSYVLFLIVCVFLYWLLPEKWKRGVLLLASIGFYLFAMPGQLPIMFVYLWLVYSSARELHGAGKRMRAVCWYSE